MGLSIDRGGRGKGKISDIGLSKRFECLVSFTSSNATTSAHLCTDLRTTLRASSGLMEVRREIMGALLRT